MGMMFLAFLSLPNSVSAQTESNILEEHYSIEVPLTPLIEALGIVRSVTNVRFVYSPSSLPIDQLVHLKVDDVPLSTILNELLGPLYIEYELIGSQIALRWAVSDKRAAYTQTIRGQVVDYDTQHPLAGAAVVIDNFQPIRGSITDENGFFEISGLPVGRHTVRAQFIGFESAYFKELLLTAGKEIVLDIGLVSSPIAMEMLVIAETPDLSVPLNDAAVVSARSFSVEHTQRFAASVSDPARMAQSFSGVSRSEDDLLNEVIVRGHSPKYTVWRLEGIEIPNPNHFADNGHSSGGVNMLSSNVLTYSDFFTGAFPAEYGNALAGVFDVQMRKGNATRPEYTIGVGALGLESTFEGPFGGKTASSYLVNYRYSTLGLMIDLGVIKQDVINYQDLSFNLHFPTRRTGTFNLFGVGGISVSEELAATNNSCGCRSYLDKEDDDEVERKGVVGLTHRVVLSDQTYLKSTVAAFGLIEREGIYLIEPSLSNERIYIDEERSVESGMRTHVALSHRLDPRHVVQLGFSGSLTAADYGFKTRFHDPLGAWRYDIDAADRVAVLRTFGQWTYRSTPRWTFHAGLHTTRFNINRETSLEPRLGIKWQANDSNILSFGSGLHSQIEPFGIYLLTDNRTGPDQNANRSLQISKSWHNVIGFEKKFAGDMRLKAEAYYNYGFDIPVSDSLGNPFSVVNTHFLYSVYARSNTLVSEGTTTNYGLDVSLEKFFSNGYYFMLNGSLLDARYTALGNTRYQSRYNTRYNINAVAGVELKIGRQKRDVLGINTRFVFGGGNRFTPVNFEASEARGFLVPEWDRINGEQLAPYHRMDLGVNFTINRPYLTHQIYIDIQNVYNHINEGFVDYDLQKRVREVDPQLGILPMVGYRITF